MCISAIALGAALVVVIYSILFHWEYYVILDLVGIIISLPTLVSCSVRDCRNYRCTSAVNFKVTLLAIMPWRVHRLAQGQQQPVHCFSCGGRQSGDLAEEEDEEREQDRGDVSDPMYSEIGEDKGQVRTFELEENSAYQSNIQVRENEAYTTHTNREKQ